MEYHYRVKVVIKSKKLNEKSSYLLYPSYFTKMQSNAEISASVMARNSAQFKRDAHV